MKNALPFLWMAFAAGVAQGAEPAAIKDARCEMTLIDGEVVWRRVP